MSTYSSFFVDRALVSAASGSWTMAAATVKSIQEVTVRELWNTDLGPSVAPIFRRLSIEEYSTTEVFDDGEARILRVDQTADGAMAVFGLFHRGSDEQRGEWEIALVSPNGLGISR